MKKIVTLFVLLGLMLPMAASAYDILDDKSVQVYVSYTEPSQNTDGSTIQDYIGTRIEYDIGQGNQVLTTLPPVNATDMGGPAPGGGVAVKLPVIVPIAAGQSVNAKFYFIAVTNHGEVMAPDPSVLPIDHPYSDPNAVTDYTTE